MQELNWKTPSELKDQYGIPPALVRRWADALEQKGQARKLDGSRWLISVDAIPFLQQRVGRVGRPGRRMTLSQAKGILAQYDAAENIHQLAKHYNVAWRTAERWLKRARVMVEKDVQRQMGEIANAEVATDEAG